MSARLSNPMDAESTIKILAVSNIHLGFAEKEQTRSDDSFNTFSEIIDVAKKYSVDMIVIAGNLFHDARPSRWTVHSALDVMRENCFGSLPIKIECLNDWSRPARGSAATLHMPNFCDPNINVELPVFAIHGFSDDPSGLGNLSELDTLDRAGMLNYYGKLTDNESVRLQPLLIRKGQTFMAMYSMGAVREEMLDRLIKDNAISFSRPEENTEAWFNVFTMHQPRGSADRKNLIGNLVEPWMDLVINGNRLDGSKDVLSKEFNVHMVEPGSTIRTTLNPDDAFQKHAILLEINKKDCRVEPIALKTVRPLIIDRFVWEESSLTDNRGEEMLAELKQSVQKALERAERERTTNRKLPWPPTVRITVESSGSDSRVVNPVRLGLEFSDTVANPKSMFKFVTRPPIKQEPGIETISQQDIKPRIFEEVKASSIDDAVATTLFDEQRNGLFSVLTAEVMLAAMKLYVEKDDNTAIENAYDWEKNVVLDHLRTHTSPTSLEEMKKDIGDYHTQREAERVADMFLEHHTQRMSQPKTKGHSKAASKPAKAKAPTAAATKKRTARKRSVSHESSPEIEENGFVEPEVAAEPVRRGARRKASSPEIIEVDNDQEEAETSRRTSNRRAKPPQRMDDISEEVINTSVQAGRRTSNRRRGGR